MRLKRDRFNALVGKQAAPVAQPAPTPAPAPVVSAPPSHAADFAAMGQRLETMEKMLRGVFINQATSTDARPPAPVVVSDPALHGRLARIEEALARSQAQEWQFDVKRGADGKLLSVLATKKAETEWRDLAN